MGGFGMKSICLFTEGNKAKYERYLEAWHLLWRAPEAGTGIEIHACVYEVLNYEDGMDWKEEMDLIQQPSPKFAPFENREDRAARLRHRGQPRRLSLHEHRKLLE
jgi:hypothetical protein